MLPRHAKGGKVLPYSDEFEAAQKEFIRVARTELDQGGFWRAIIRCQSAKRRPPPRTKVAVPVVDEDDDAE
jgi:hypothetical protein